MSYHYRRLKESQIIQKEIEKQRSPQSKNNEILNSKPLRKADIKLAFFRDILSKSFSADECVWDKIQARKEALVKHGYWTKEGEITELGYEKLAKYLLNKPISG